MKGSGKVKKKDEIVAKSNFVDVENTEKGQIKKSSNCHNRVLRGYISSLLLYKTNRSHFSKCLSSFIQE